MKKRIRQLARGQFEYSKPGIILPATPISFQVMEGKDYEGTFVLSGEDNAVLRGMVYCLDSRMECATSRFEGQTAEIRFVFHSKGLPDGTRHQGRFEIVCSQNVVDIPFLAEVTRPFFESSVGPIRNLNDFTRLAQENWQEACRLFYHPGFSGILAGTEKKDRLLYRAATDVYPSNQNMEEFLIGTGRKRKILFRTQPETFSCWGIREETAGEIRIRKDGWGYLKLSLESEGDFIRISEPEIGPSQFSGSDAVLKFTILPEKLHGGKNYGSITICSPYQSITIPVTAAAREKHAPVVFRVGKERALLNRLMSGCISWKLRRKTTAAWASESLDLLRQLYALRPDRTEYLLMKAYCCFCNRQRHETEKALAEYAPYAEQAEDGFLALYRYLTWQLERKGDNRHAMEEEILAICSRSIDSDLCYVVQHMTAQTENDTEYLKEIGRRIEARMVSPWLMLEASLMILTQPQLLTGVTGYQRRILLWIRRHKALNKELAARVMALSDFARGFDHGLYQVLCECWELSPKKEHTASICRYLIRGNCLSPEYLEWYQRGITEGLKITRLYEAYLMSMDDMDVAKIPRSMQMYFQYDTPLPYQKMAVMYCNIIAWKERDPDLYRRYQHTIGRFALDQAEQKHMDDNLALIYADMLPPSIMNAKMAHDLADILFCYKVAVWDASIVKVIVYHWQLKDPVEVAVANGRAYIPVYSEDSCILLEDAQGNRYSGSMYYHIEQLMEPQLYAPKARELAPDEIPYIISLFDSVKDYRSFREEDQRCFDRFLLHEEVSDLYKAQMVPEILKFYQGLEQDEKMKRYLAITDFALMPPADRQFVTELMVSCGMFDLAWERLQEYGADLLGPYSRSQVLEARIRKLEGEPDTLTVAMSAQTVVENRYNETMLSYLCEFYVGPAPVMEVIWRLAVYYKIPADALGERILVTILYTDRYLENELRIFTDYVRSRGTETIIEAFLASRAQAYFMEGRVMDSSLFELIRSRYMREKEVCDACKLALLKYYSGCTVLEEREKLACDLLLGEMVGRDMYFAFYRKLSPALLHKYHLQGLVFLEYRTKPGSQVTVYLSRDEDGQEFFNEDMHEVYYGIYVKSFVLFFGELIRYYIKEETSEAVTMRRISRLMPDDCVSTWSDGRYQMVNQILMSRVLKEDEEMEQEMLDYQQKEVLASSLFHILE